MKRYIISLALFAMSIIGVMAQDDPIWWYFGPNYLYYYNDFIPDFPDALIRCDMKAEEVEGKTYYIARYVQFGRSYGDTFTKPEIKETDLHMRAEGKRVLVRYDEYKALMQGRGYDMEHFDEQCQYEVTADGDLVLYDFGMQVGDKFRSVPGKEDVYVVDRHKEFPSRVAHTQENRDVICLSNGAKIVENIGYKGLKENYGWYREASGDFFDYLNFSSEYGMGLAEAMYNYEYVWEDHLDGPSAVALPQVEKELSPFFDLQGRRMTGQPTKGIYIHNGRKVVVK